MDKASDIKAALPFLINLNYTKKGLLSDELRVRGSRKGSEEAVQLENWNVLARRKAWRGTAARLPGPGPAARSLRGATGKLLGLNAHVSLPAKGGRGGNELIHSKAFENNAWHEVSTLFENRTFPLLSKTQNPYLGSSDRFPNEAYNS